MSRASAGVIKNGKCSVQELYHSNQSSTSTSTSKHQTQSHRPPLKSTDRLFHRINASEWRKQLLNSRDVSKPTKYLNMKNVPSSSCVNGCRMDHIVNSLKRSQMSDTFCFWDWLPWKQMITSFPSMVPGLPVKSRTWNTPRMDDGLSLFMGWFWSTSLILLSRPDRSHSFPLKRATITAVRWDLQLFVDRLIMLAMGNNTAFKCCTMGCNLMNMALHSL